MKMDFFIIKNDIYDVDYLPKRMESSDVSSTYDYHRIFIIYTYIINIHKYFYKFIIYNLINLYSLFNMLNIN